MVQHARFPLVALALILSLAVGAGCAAKAGSIPGTRIADNSENRQILTTIESYRKAVEDKDVAALVLMASQRYWEDSGTPTGSDDYGYDGLRNVLAGRYQQADEIRFSLRYLNLRRRCPPNTTGNEGCKVYVEVMIDASYTIADARGQSRRPDMRDQNELVLEWSGERESWLFLSGM
jgi:hypothetical protein